MDSKDAEIARNQRQIEEVEAEIKQAKQTQAEDSAEEVRQLRRKEEQLRKKDEQLRAEKLIILGASGKHLHLRPYAWQ